MESQLTYGHLRWYFNRLGFSFFLYLFISDVLGLGVLLVFRSNFETLRHWCRSLFGIFPSYEAFFMPLNDLLIYLPALLLFPLLLSRFPLPDERPQRPLPLGELLLAICFCYGADVLLSLATNYGIAFFNGLTGFQSSNSLSDVMDYLPAGITLFCFGVVAPICEEFIFRRLLLDRLRFLGDTAAIVLSAAAFGLFHMNLYQLFYAFALGVCFAAIAIMTGRIRYSILIHAIINTFSTVLTLYDLPDAIYAYYSLFVLVSMILAVVFFFLRFRRYQFDPGPTVFTAEEKRNACFSSPWVWIVLVVSLAYSVVSIYL